MNNICHFILLSKWCEFECLKTVIIFVIMFDVSSIDFTRLERTELNVFTFPSVSECNGCRKVKCSQVLSYDGNH